MYLLVIRAKKLQAWQQSIGGLAGHTTRPRATESVPIPNTQRSHFPLKQRLYLKATRMPAVNEFP